MSGAEFSGRGSWRPSPLPRSTPGSRCAQQGGESGQGVSLERRAQKAAPLTLRRIKPGRETARARHPEPFRASSRSRLPRAQVRLWGASHVGGHRFAPTALVFPGGAREWRHARADFFYIPAERRARALLGGSQPFSSLPTHGPCRPPPRSLPAPPRVAAAAAAGPPSATTRALVRPLGPFHALDVFRRAPARPH